MERSPWTYKPWRGWVRYRRRRKGQEQRQPQWSPCSPVVDGDGDDGDGDDDGDVGDDDGDDDDVDTDEDLDDAKLVHIGLGPCCQTKTAHLGLEMLSQKQKNKNKIARSIPL